MNPDTPLTNGREYTSAAWLKAMAEIETDEPPDVPTYVYPSYPSAAAVAPLASDTQAAMVARAWWNARTDPDGIGEPAEAAEG